MLAASLAYMLNRLVIGFDELPLVIERATDQAVQSYKDFVHERFPFLESIAL